MRTYNTIITACSKAGQAEEGLKLYDRMVSAGIRPSATTYTALISAYGKKGQVEKAMDIYQDMIRKGCERNVITYSSLISACERAGRCELAIDLLNKMHLENIRPNVVTYNSLIAACAHGGWPQLGLAVASCCLQAATLPATRHIRCAGAAGRCSRRTCCDHWPTVASSRHSFRQPAGSV